MNISIAIVDDNKHIIKHLEKIVENEPTLNVVFSANSASELMKLMEISDLPDVILMDVNMPEITGIEATKMVKSKYPNTKVLMLTAFDEDEYIFESIINGASGYLLKEDTNDQLLQSINLLYNGGAPMSPAIAYKTLDLLRKISDNKTVSEQNKFNLTKREIEIIQLTADGEDYNQIAEKLFISPKTVRNHIQNIYEKLQVHNKAEAVIKAMRNDIIK